MNEKAKMINQQLYMASDEQLVKERLNVRLLLDKYNNTSLADYQTRKQLLPQIVGKIGTNYNLEQPFYCDYGYNIEIGENFYANYDCIFLDVAKIRIGNNVMIAPLVSIYTATHPLDKDIRNSGLEQGLNVTIGNDVWIGGNTVINPGVTIGDNVVIGSGSVVTKDIPSNSLAVGNPCKVIRKL